MPEQGQCHPGPSTFPYQQGNEQQAPAPTPLEVHDPYAAPLTHNFRMVPPRHGQNFPAGNFTDVHQPGYGQPPYMGQREVPEQSLPTNMKIHPERFSKHPCPFSTNKFAEILEQHSLPSLIFGSTPKTLKRNKNNSTGSLCSVFETMFKNNGNGRSAPGTMSRAEDFEFLPEGKEQEDKEPPYMPYMTPELDTWDMGNSGTAATSTTVNSIATPATSTTSMANEAFTEQDIESLFSQVEMLARVAHNVPVESRDNFITLIDAKLRSLLRAMSSCKTCTQDQQLKELGRLSAVKDTLKRIGMRTTGFDRAIAQRVGILFIMNDLGKLSD